jgi:N-acetylglucosaminyldiphosphoundecaprenol N-acetyl-beta-D-mannosaminyltransferase
MRDMDTENILGFPITILERDDCINQICTWIRSNEKGRCLVCANPHSLEQARSDPLFKRAICHADLVTPDGIGVILASRIQCGAIRFRITGSDIFWGLSNELNQKPGYRYFFLGSTEKTLALIREKMRTVFPDIEVAGMYSPPFKSEFSPEESQEMVEAVNSSEPHVLWVGMTAPKQEKWISQHRDQLNVPFIGAVGAVFDFFAGTANRSPQWFRDRGYEWLPRLIREPKRLWYRNFVSFPIFVMRSVVRRLES